ncbi:MAG: hypothetical protein KDA20_06865 [Phycisphaerales bacterium]|nr:hypothetical protein [Phycisphaerales bacterium]
MQLAKVFLLVLGITGSADAFFFSINSVDASDGTVGGGLVGTGLNFNGGVLYQDPFGTAGNLGEPNQAGIALAPSLAFDSYLTIDRDPVEAAPGYDGTDVAQPFEWTGSPGFDANGYRGGWNVLGFVNSFQAPKDFWYGTEETRQIFVGRITLDGGFLSGRLAAVIREPGDATLLTIAGDLNDEGSNWQTWDYITSDITNRPLAKASQGRGYAWVVKSFDVDIEGTTYTVHDIYLQNVGLPSPGAMSLLGLAGVCATRRRR